MMSVEELEAYLDSPEGQASMEKFIKEQIAERERVKSFYGTKRFEELLSLFDASGDDRIDGDHWMYGNELDYITYDEYNDLWGSIWDVHEDEIVEDTEAMFTTLTLNFRGYKLTLIHGQGSVSILEKVK